MRSHTLWDTTNHEIAYTTRSPTPRYPLHHELHHTTRSPRHDIFHITRSPTPWDLSHNEIEPRDPPHGVRDPSNHEIYMTRSTTSRDPPHHEIHQTMRSTTLRDPPHHGIHQTMRFTLGRFNQIVLGSTTPWDASHYQYNTIYRCVEKYEYDYRISLFVDNFHLVSASIGTRPALLLNDI